jgi:dihydroorotase
MAEVGTILCIHGEVTDPSVDVFDRERVFIDEILKPLIASHPNLKIVMEHITTAEAVEFITSSSPNIAATITAHHLLYNRNDIFKGGICPHMYCLPILKRETHRQALLQAASSGNPKFFAGTDSAPHSLESKESSCGCAGIFTAHAAVEFYAEALESVDALDKLEGFLSRYGAEFYGLPINSTKIRLVKEPWTVPDSYPFGKTTVIPLARNATLQWKAIA